MSCPCNDNCPVLQSSFYVLLMEAIHEKVSEKLYTLNVPNFQIYSHERKIFHINWYEDSNVFHRRALDAVLCNMFIPDTIIHYDNDSLSNEFNTTNDFHYSHLFCNKANIKIEGCDDMSNKYQDVIAFWELRKTEYSYLTDYKTFHRDL